MRRAPIAKNIEALLATPAQKNQPFDVLIIGSGYGGAIAAHQLAGKNNSCGRPLRIALLERGAEYRAGDFPSSTQDTPTHVRLATHGKRSGNPEGLFDFRLGDDVHTVLANGLGGGSLINAGVMEEPLKKVFAHKRWPKAVSQKSLAPYFKKARRILGATRRQPAGKDATNHAASANLNKTQDVREGIAQSSKHYRHAAITVAMSDKQTCGGVSLKACTLCGDCASGCNHNAKESLDTNLLADAHNKGVLIYTGATVVQLERDHQKQLWRIHTRYTNDHLHTREGGTFILKAHKVILSAGSLGSTEILLKSQANNHLSLSPTLGTKFSANGDMILADYNKKARVDAIALHADNTHRRIGPTITAVADFRKKAGLLFEDLAVPHTLAQLFSQLITSYHSLNQLSRFNTNKPTNATTQESDDKFSLNSTHISHTAVYAAMADDGANGRLALAPDVQPHAHDKHMIDAGDANIIVDWPELKNADFFDDAVSFLKQRKKRYRLNTPHTTRGNIIPNILWNPLPENFSYFNNNARYAPITVHPLGGCPMSDSWHHGVVNEFGQIYEASSGLLYDGLVVLDGSIIPTALGTNPALTIASISLRAMEHLIKQWQFHSTTSYKTTSHPGSRHYKPKLHSHITPSIPQRFHNTQHSLHTPTHKQIKSHDESTKITLLERLVTDTQTPIQIAGQAVIMEIVIYYHETPLNNLTNLKENKNHLEVDSSRSQLRIFSVQDYHLLRQANTTAERAMHEHSAIFNSPLSGKLTVFTAVQTSTLEKIHRASTAWLKNHPLNISHRIITRIRKLPAQIFSLLRQRRSTDGRASIKTTFKHLCSTINHSPETLYRLYKRAISLLKILSHAGEQRQLHYILKTQPIRHRKPHTMCKTSTATVQAISDKLADITFHGTKTITYAHEQGLWEQLSELHLTDFPSDTTSSPTLWLDKTFFLETNTPLFQITAHKNVIKAAEDLNTFFSFIQRMVVNIHLLNLKKPDKKTDVIFDSLPGQLAGIEAPEIIIVNPNDYIKNNTHANQNDSTSHTDSNPDLEGTIRLTRYKNNSCHPPVLLIHGYSASGTTYAHEKLELSLASYLHRKGRDVWVADLRCSVGLSTGLYRWNFEHMAFCDIPLVLDKITTITGKKVDVIAHCMGAVMLSMSILGATNNHSSNPFEAWIQATPNKINRIVTSQGSPFLVLAPENRMRAYLASHFLHFLNDFTFTFADTNGQSANMMDTLLNRLLNFLPKTYQNSQAAKANNNNGSFAAINNRMNLFYNQTMSLQNTPNTFLNNIEDFFYGFNANMLTQVMHFGLKNTVTDAFGNTPYTQPENIKSWSKIPTLHIHGQDNGLIDAITPYQTQRHFKDSVNYQFKIYKNTGHQDCLVGRKSVVLPIFRDIVAFLNSEIS